MNHDRITAIRVKGLRSLADVELMLSDLTVLIGPNGAGKSSLVEVCELLRKAGTDSTFFDALASTHGGAASLVRRGAHKLEIEAEIDGAEGLLRYALALSLERDQYLQIRHERISRFLGDRWIQLVFRDALNYWAYDRTGVRKEALAPTQRSIGPGELVLNVRVEALGDGPGGELDRVKKALASIEVHTPVDVRPRWVAQSETGARAANVVQGARRLALDGKNLSNALLQLRNQRNFASALADMRLGLGDDFEDLVLKPMPSGGQIAVEVRLRRGWELPMFSLSDGQVAYLAQVVIAHGERPYQPSLVVLDEPELHFHPGLTVRLAQMIEGASERFPVLVATQSDAFLDTLTEPAAAAVLCELDEDRATRLSRPDPVRLRSWLEDYAGLGALRRSGFDQLVFEETERSAADGS